jgi:hypothetical protein
MRFLFNAFNSVHISIIISPSLPLPLPLPQDLSPHSLSIRELPKSRSDPPSSPPLTSAFLLPGDLAWGVPGTCSFNDVGDASLNGVGGARRERGRSQMRELSTAMVRVVAGGHGVGTGLGMSAAGEHSVTTGRPRCEHGQWPWRELGQQPWHGQGSARAWPKAMVRVGPAASAADRHGAGTGLGTSAAGGHDASTGWHQCGRRWCFLFLFLSFFLENGYHCRVNNRQ